MKKILELCLQKKIDLFCKTLLQTNRGFNYYVNWDNIKGYEKYSIEIHAIDTLIKIEDDTKFESEFKKLLKKLPTTTLLFPFLFGLAKVEREKLNKGKSELTIIQDEIDEADSLDYTFKSDVNKLQDEEIEKYYASNPQPIGFSGILLAKRQNSFYCTYFLHNRNVADTKSPYPIKRLEVIRWFNQKSMVFNQSLS